MKNLADPGERSTDAAFILSTWLIQRQCDEYKTSQSSHNISVKTAVDIPRISALGLDPLTDNRSSPKSPPAFFDIYF